MIGLILISLLVYKRPKHLYFNSIHSLCSQTFKHRIRCNLLAQLLSLCRKECDQTRIDLCLNLLKSK